ncbi:MAG: twin-arginine translocase subunit TatC [Candidatus Schekmanbacteria bacterium]|nr:MAG: twin-arginine translocase subunit TatC [Candidatus Schekmanbacteria bacterium]
MESRKEELSSDKEMTFLQHLEELRSRLIHIIIYLILGFIGSYAFSKSLFKAVIRPLSSVLSPEQKLVFTSPAQPFIVYIKISAIMGAFFAFPLIFYEIWKFVAPGLYRKEKIYGIVFFVSSCIFFIGGASFAYFLLLPYCFKFLLSYGGDFLPMLTIKEALSTVAMLLFAFGLAFELPVFVFIIAKIGLISIETLKKGRPYVILILFAASAIITPPDVVSQIALAIPMYILYEFSILLVRLLVKKND